MGTPPPYPLTPPEKYDAEFTIFLRLPSPFLLLMSVNEIYKLVKFQEFWIMFRFAGLHLKEKSYRIKKQDYF